MVTPDRLREAMGRALFLADKARESGDVPVGAMVLDSTGRTVGQGWNQRERDHDPSAHAEIIALRDAGRRLNRWNLVGCTLVVTLEPCTMCAGAIVQARIDRVVFATWDPKAGAAGSVRDVLRDSRLNHRVEVIGGVLEEEAAVQLRGFFSERRDPESAGASSVPVPVRPSAAAPPPPVGWTDPAAPATSAPAASHPYFLGSGSPRRPWESWGLSSEERSSSSSTRASLNADTANPSATGTRARAQHSAGEGAVDPGACEAPSDATHRHGPSSNRQFPVRRHGHGSARH